MLRDEDLAAAAVAGIFIVIILILMQRICACNDKKAESYFYPTGMNEVSPTPHYRTIMRYEGASNDSAGTNNSDNSNSDNGSGNGLGRGSELELKKDKTGEMFDFKPNPDDDIYTNMETPIHTVVPDCARNKGYLGDYGNYKFPVNNDLRRNEVDAGNIQPEFLYPHSPYGDKMGL